jgi:predicted Zn-dependent protease
MVIIFFPSWITGSAIQDAIEMSLFLVVFAITFTALARNSEYQADAFAAEMAGKENFASGLETLQQNIMPTSGKIPAWLLTHPEIPDRINRVRYWQGTINDLLKKSRRTRQMLIALAVLLMIATIPALGPVMQLSRLANAARAGDLTQGRRALDSLPGWLLSHPLTVRESGKLAMKTGRWDIAFFQGVKAHWNLNSVVRSEELHHSAAPEVAFYFKFMQFMLQTLDLG